MKKVFSQTTEKYFYNDEKERIKHVEKMRQNGWRVSSEDKRFIANLYLDDVDDDKNYRWFAEFYKNNLKKDSYCSYSPRFQDLATVYIKDGDILKNRSDRVFNIPEEIKNFNNIVIENNKIIDIYCSKEKSDWYKNEIKLLKKHFSNIEECIKIHVNNLN